MSYTRELVRNINKGINLSENIKAYQTHFSDLSNQISLLHIAMEYFVLYQVVEENETAKDEELQEVIQFINETIEKVFVRQAVSDEEKKKMIAEIVTARELVTKKMRILTMYTDQLAIYEHVVNRIELKYENIEEGEDIETFVAKTCNAIFAQKDNTIINENIRSVMGELPVRMARGKFFQLLENGLSVYQELDKTSFERVIYLLESSAGLYAPEGVENYFPAYREFVQRLQKRQLKVLSEAEFRAIYDELEEKANQMSDISNFYITLQQILNMLYCFIASYTEQALTDPSDQVCYAIVQGIYQMFICENEKGETVALEEKFALLEGKQEQLLEEFMLLQSALEDVLMGHQDILEKEDSMEQMLILDQIATLLSSYGTFFEFDPEPEQDEAIDAAYIEAETQKLIQKFETAFQGRERCVVRAIMAITLSKLPVFFQNTDELQTYIRSALEDCKDVAERQASMNLIAMILGFSEE